MPVTKASMYISPACMMVVSPQLNTEVHEHVVMQFTCSLEGKPFSLWTEQDGWQRVEAVLINSGVAHSVKDFNGWQATICMLPDARKGKLMQEKVLDHAAFKYFKTSDILPIIDALQVTREKLFADNRAFHSVIDAVYSHLLQDPIFAPPLDDRISRTVRFIRENIHQNISASALAREVHLSEHRFLHLFREQTGVPLRKYVLWQRLVAAIEAFIDGKSAKEAAYEAGFSDPAHFSRTFLQMFGALPSSYAAIKTIYHCAFFQDI